MLYDLFIYLFVFYTFGFHFQKFRKTINIWSKKKNIYSRMPLISARIWLMSICIDYKFELIWSLLVLKNTLASLYSYLNFLNTAL